MDRDAEKRGRSGRGKTEVFAGGMALGAVLAGGIVWAASAGVFLSPEARAARDMGRTIAVSWGDGKYGKAFYGAQVYLVPRENGFSVRARVMIDGAHHWHDCGELGAVETRAQAVARWSQVDWRPEGLYIGAGENRHFTPRARIESHR